MRHITATVLGFLIVIASTQLHSSSISPAGQAPLLAFGAAVTLLIGLFLIKEDAPAMFLNSIFVALQAVLSTLRGIEAANISSNTSVGLYLGAVGVVLILAMMFRWFGIARAIDGRVLRFWRTLRDRMTCPQIRSTGS